jgi:hypothetical protein
MKGGGELKLGTMSTTHLSATQGHSKVAKNTLNEGMMSMDELIRQPLQLTSDGTSSPFTSSSPVACSPLAVSPRGQTLWQRLSSAILPFAETQFGKSIETACREGLDEKGGEVAGGVFTANLKRVRKENVAANNQINKAHNEPATKPTNNNSARKLRRSSRRKLRDCTNDLRSNNVQNQTC